MRRSAVDRFLLHALALAKRANPSPNPRVGAVLVKGGKVVGTGYHRKAGGPHAEILALRSASSKARGATLYLTLEPCCHYGRTPPCTDAVIKYGIRKVVVALRDPNPLVAGKGIAQLRKAGIRVTLVPPTHTIAEQTRQLNLTWIKRITTGMPYVTLKVAQSLDGKICASTGDSKWISSEESRKYVHQLRQECDAIIVGIGTVLADDPQLTARTGKNFSRLAKRQPLRIILDRHLQISPTARVLADARAIICCSYGADPEKQRLLKQKGIAVLEFDFVPMRKVLQELGKREINSVMIEGGAGIYTAALEEGVVDRLICFIAPKLIGGRDAKTMFEGHGVQAIADAMKLRNVQVQRMGIDVVVEGDFLR